jgi:putative phage-type endonuclease
MPENNGKNGGASVLTPEQIELRSHGVGASEVAAVCNVDPYRNALDVFLEKTKQVEPFAGNEPTEWGNRLEGVIADAYAERMGVQVERDCGTIVATSADWRMCTPDGLVTGANRGVEVKNRNYFNWKEWGEPGTDEVPIEVVAQVQTSMDIVGLPLWDVAVLLGGNRLGIYHLEYDAEVAADLRQKVDDFWHNNVLAKVTPSLDGSESAARYLNNKWKLYGEDLKVPTEEIVALALELKDLRVRLKEGGLREDEIKNLIRDFIGDDTGLQMPGDGGKITWKRPKASEIINWRMVAVGLSRGRHKLHARLVELHKSEKANPRRFLPQFK